jgi:hypothetical protein
MCGVPPGRVAWQVIVWPDEATAEAAPAGRRPSSTVSDGDPFVQIKVWLLGVSSVVWRRVLVPATYTLRELHGVFQVVMGW